MSHINKLTTDNLPPLGTVAGTQGIWADSTVPLELLVGRYH